MMEPTNPRANFSYPSCLPPGHESFLPRSASFEASHSAPTPSCSPPPRPVPPTPQRMKLYAMDQPDHDQAARHRKRYSAASAIPRPTSGTSRRATPPGVPHINNPPEHLADPSSVHRRSFHSQDGKPPSSWTASKPRLPRSDSLLPCSQRPQQDLSGLKQQLQIRHLSTQSLNSSKIALPRNPLLIGSSLPKSQSSSSLLSPSRNVTPGRRLMKPLGPPFPKSQTFSNLSCTNLPTTTPSPPKPQPRRLTGLVDSGNNHVSVVDALRESRMTDQEIMHLKQVQKEDSQNQNQLQHAFEIRQHKKKHSPASGSVLRAPEEATINLSANDVANTRRLEEQRRQSTSLRPLFVHSALASTDPVSPEIKMPSPISSSSSSWADDDWPANLNLVYFAVEPAYWAGRYMTISDRLRTENMKASITASLESPNSSGSDDGFDSAEKRRLNAALKELQDCCRTDDALKSLQIFEMQLRKDMQILVPVRQPRTGCSGSDFSDDTEPTLGTRLKTKQSLQCRVAPLAIRRGSRILTPINTERPLPSIFGRLAFAKSKTTGNLASLSTFGISNLPGPKLSKPPTATMAELKPVGVQNHIRRKSGIQISEKQREEALKGREEKAWLRAAETERRISGRTISFSSTVSNPRSVDSDSKNSHLRQSSTSVPAQLCQNTEQGMQVGECVSSSTHVRGHRLPPPRPPTPYEVDLKDLGTEKLVKSRRRPERQTSGEIMKTFFDVGISQVKRMGRRVGGSMSWTGSAEDVSVVISPKSECGN